MPAVCMSPEVEQESIRRFNRWMASRPKDRSYVVGARGVTLIYRGKRLVAEMRTRPSPMITILHPVD